MRKQKGITLIALVITIIVLLILAGVSITMISGDDGIVTRASDAAQKTEEKSQEEMEKLGTVDDYIDSQVSGTNAKNDEEDENTDGNTGENSTETGNESGDGSETNTGDGSEGDTEPVVGSISFYICDKQFYAEENMTFGEWVADTRYNTCGAKFMSDGFVWIPFADWNEGLYHCVGEEEHDEGGCYLNYGEYIDADYPVPDGAPLTIACGERG